MTIQEWGSIGELIGGTAVIATLIYLAIQIRQNTRQITASVEASRLAALERNIESGIHMREFLLLNPEIATLFQRGCEDYDSLNEGDRVRFGLFMSNVMTSFQAAYLRHKSVDEDPQHLEGSARFFDSILGRPGARAWLDSRDSDFRPEFREFIEQRLASLSRDGVDAPPEPTQSSS